MHHAGDDSRPAGLVARAEAGPVVAVEVFVEQQAIAPVRVVLELLGPTVDGTPTVLVAQEHVGQSSRDLPGYLIQVHAASGPRGTLHRRSEEHTSELQSPD